MRPHLAPAHYAQGLHAPKRCGRRRFAPEWCRESPRPITAIGARKATQAKADNVRSDGGKSERGNTQSRGKVACRTDVPDRHSAGTNDEVAVI
jgi:hypothetical protein